MDWLSEMRLRSRGIHTMDDLADLAPDELAEIAEISTNEACSILKQARAH